MTVRRKGDLASHRSEGLVMGGSQTIRSLERGLMVLQAMQENPISSLHDIYQQTRISKPSLLRILYTLEHSGLVSRRLADGRYRISTNLSHLARKRDRYDHVAEAAAPVLDRHVRRSPGLLILWYLLAITWKFVNRVGCALRLQFTSCKTG